MVEQVYVFDHYKDELYIIATNQFSNSTKSDLENRVNKSIEDLTKINHSCLHKILILKLKKFNQIFLKKDLSK